MAVINGKPESVQAFTGLDTLIPATNLPPVAWFESSNVIVGGAGTAVALRSPKAWNASPVNSTVRSTYSYLSPSQGPVVFFDENASNLATLFYTTGGANTSIPILTGSSALPQNAGQRFCFTTANERCYFVNGAGVFWQVYYDTNAAAWVNYHVGLPAPASAPTVSIVSGGSLVLNVGVTVSYAYYNASTGHVGPCSLPSTISGPTSGGNQTLQIAVVQNTNATLGVTGIVLFITTDGGAVRYLVTSAGLPDIFPNTTGNISLTSQWAFDINTTETLFNQLPPVAFYNVIFKHQNRIILLNSKIPTTTSILNYSGLESIGVGNPTESYPPLNIVALPAKGEPMKGGISTPVGAIVFSDREAYLLAGQLIDIIVSAQNPLQTSYSFASLQWGLGTRSPFTLKVTPFGLIWLDQNKRLQMWSYSGLPTEIGLALRGELKAIQDTDAARFMAEATWFQYGEQQYYVLSASTSGSANNKLFIIGIYESPEHEATAYTIGQHAVNITTAVSDIPGQTIIEHIDQNGQARCLLTKLFANDGVTADGGQKEILNLDLQGDGWAASQKLYFGVVTGSFPGNPNWSSVHSIRYDSQANDIQPNMRNFDDSEAIALNPENLPNENYSFQGTVDRYGVHKKLRFVYPMDDAKRREIQNLRITYSEKTRP